MPLNETARYILHADRLCCARIVEIQNADAARLYGLHAVWKDVFTTAANIALDV